MSLDYIRRTYAVPAVRGGRVRYTGGSGKREGTIIGASGAHRTIRLDGDKHGMPFHPTWELEYLGNAGSDREGAGPPEATPDVARNLREEP